MAVVCAARGTGSVVGRGAGWVAQPTVRIARRSRPVWMEEWIMLGILHSDRGMG